MTKEEYYQHWENLLEEAKKKERDRILGIIEEMVQRREPHPKFGHPKFYIDALSGLYEKIKGEID